MVSAHKEWLCSALCEGGKSVEGVLQRSLRRECEAGFCPGSGVVESGQKQSAIETGELPAWKSPSGLVPVKRAGASRENLSPQVRQSGSHVSSWSDAQNCSK